MYREEDVSQSRDENDEIEQTGNNCFDESNLYETCKKINETNSNTNVPLRYSGGEAMIIQNFELIETNLPDYLYNLYL